MHNDSGYSRRGFLKGTTLGTVAGTAFPYLIPSHVLGKPGKPGANDRIRVGVIGAGNRTGLLIDQLPPEANLVAVADCYVRKAEEAAAKRKANWRIYKSHLELLEQSGFRPACHSRACNWSQGRTCWTVSSLANQVYWSVRVSRQ